MKPTPVPKNPKHISLYLMIEPIPFSKLQFTTINDENDNFKKVKLIISNHHRKPLSMAKLVLKLDLKVQCMVPTILIHPVDAHQVSLVAQNHSVTSNKMRMRYLSTSNMSL